MSRSFPRMLAIVAVAVCALLGPAAVATAEAAPQHPRSSARWRACTTHLDGVRTWIARTQRSVTIVNQTSRSHARVSFWVRTHSRCSLSRLFLTRSGRIGYGGTVAATKRRQGSGTTPLGTFTMTEAFGNGPAPKVWLPYHRVRTGDYWVGDNASRYYNSLRNKKSGGFRYWLPSSRANSSEYLPSYGRQYRYSVVINFNRAPQSRVRYRGTGIFLHVKGRGATAGCVAVTAAQMRTVLAHLKPGDRITIAR
ncbi:MAG TPA: L,D-transpeptidase family protein [Propionibacteriaceae bacterium]|nr:L,D-transpeptidase family protein [Propionibacteriaceae bacterium]